MTPTAARPTSEQSCHWYHKNGVPCYEVARATGQGTRPTTLADARKLNLLPSVTTILRVLHKQGLVDWLIEQACLAVLTTPRPAEEPLDAFVERVLHEERIQDQESQKARDFGTDIHAALEAYFSGNQEVVLHEWILPAANCLMSACPTVLHTEKILIGDGYAGKCDFIGECDDCYWLIDWKTTKRLPQKSWSEAKLQLAAYAKILENQHGKKPIRVANIYISTLERGQFVFASTEDWRVEYENGFKPLLRLWQHLNQYDP